MTTPTTSVLTNAEWRAEGVRLFDTEDVMQWKFRCVSCGTASSPADFDKLGANPRRAQNECIGRIHVELGGLPDLHIDGNSKPCNWAAGGMFRLSTVIEVESPHGGTGLAFPFADGEPPAPVYAPVWDGSCAPGGMVCNLCGTPVESEPCSKHATTEELRAAGTLTEGAAL